MYINFVNKQVQAMKKIFILLALSVCFLAGANAQKEQANWNAADYYTYDTTTFFLNIAPGIRWVYFDISTLSADDAVLHVGNGGWDMESVGNLTWTSGGAAEDSVVLSTTTYAVTIRRSNGTRYTNSRVYLWFEEGIPSSYLGVTIRWNSVTSGRIKVYY